MYPNASFRKLKIYSSAEIAQSNPLEKIRRQFWNIKGEELCRDKKLNKWKASALHGVLDTAWTLKKIHVISPLNQQIARREITGFEHH